MLEELSAFLDTYTYVSSEQAAELIDAVARGEAIDLPNISPGRTSSRYGAEVYARALMLRGSVEKELRAANLLASERRETISRTPTDSEPVTDARNSEYAERARVAAILTLPEAKGLTEFAQHLALQTNLSVEIVRTQLSLAQKNLPKATIPTIEERSRGMPEFGGSFTPMEGKAERTARGMSEAMDNAIGKLKGEGA